MNQRTSTLLTRCVIAVLSLALAAPVLAVPVDVNHVNLENCDFLSVPYYVDELGIGLASMPPGPFPPDEEITSSDVSTDLVACPVSDTAAPNVRVTMTNLTTRAFDEVWYVADPETTLSNFDGVVNDELAFRIDSVISGVSNLPLVFESGAINDIFEPGETWEFIIDDYANALGLPASAFLSAGLVGGASPGVPSSGSIIVIPEPVTLSLLALGGLVLTTRRRR